MTFTRKRCPHCKGKLDQGQRIHDHCVAPWAEAREAKSARKAAKQVAAAAKVERAEARKRKESMKTRADYMKEAQAALNAWVRWRDKDQPCISCGRFHQGENHAGHYLSRGAHPELALEPKNLSLQCQPCNVHLSGNQINYRKGLIARHGVEFVEWLEGPHESKKQSIQELIEIRDFYKADLKRLKRATA